MRRNILINENWKFIEPGKEPIVLNLPHTWNGVDGQNGGNNYRRITAKYIKNLAKPQLNSKDRAILVFCGVNSEAIVFLNGSSIYSHNGGYSKFVIDITNYLKDENVLEVEVSNVPNNNVYPQKADFTFYGGIYRDIYIEIVPENHFAYREYAAPPLKIKTDVENKNGLLQVDANVTGVGETYISVYDQENKLVATGNSNEVLTIENAHLWNGIIDPYLYRIKAQLINNGLVEDEIETSFGFRTFIIDATNGFILNGKPYPLRGVSKHQDRPLVGNAITKENIEEDIKLIKEIGANSIRLAHYQHDDYVYELCDKAGLIVRAEIPYISEHLLNSNENIEQQLKELILQLFNHPSIVVWGISNEITIDNNHKEEMLTELKKLNKSLHELDKKRPSVLACYSMCSMFNKTAHITDVVAWNLYFGWYTPWKWLYKARFFIWRTFYKTRAVGLSEYGAEGMPNLHSKRPKRGDNTEEYQANYHEYMLKFISKANYLWCTYVWNMFDFASDARDQGGEPGMNHKGLVSFDRKIKKDAFYLYKAYWSNESFIHICGKRFINRTGRKIKIKVYSNLEKISIYNNGKKISEKSGNKVFVFTLKMEKENHIEAKCENCFDEIYIRRADKKNASYVLKKHKNNSTKSWEKTK